MGGSESKEGGDPQSPNGSMAREDSLPIVPHPPDQPNGGGARARSPQASEHQSQSNSQGVSVDNRSFGRSLDHSSVSVHGVSSLSMEQGSELTLKSPPMKPVGVSPGAQTPRKQHRFVSVKNTGNDSLSNSIVSQSDSGSNSNSNSMERGRGVVIAKVGTRETTGAGSPMSSSLRSGNSSVASSNVSSPKSGKPRFVSVYNREQAIKEAAVELDKPELSVPDAAQLPTVPQPPGSPNRSPHAGSISPSNPRGNACPPLVDPTSVDARESSGDGISPKAAKRNVSFSNNDTTGSPRAHQDKMKPRGSALSPTSSPASSPLQKPSPPNTDDTKGITLCLPSVSLARVPSERSTSHSREDDESLASPAGMRDRVKRSISSSSSAANSAGDGVFMFPESPTSPQQQASAGAMGSSFEKRVDRIHTEMNKGDDELFGDMVESLGAQPTKKFKLMGAMPAAVEDPSNAGAQQAINQRVDRIHTEINKGEDELFGDMVESLGAQPPKKFNLMGGAGAPAAVADPTKQPGYDQRVQNIESAMAQSDGMFGEMLESGTTEKTKRVNLNFGGGPLATNNGTQKFVRDPTKQPGYDQRVEKMESAMAQSDGFGEMLESETTEKTKRIKLNFGNGTLSSAQPPPPPPGQPAGGRPLQRFDQSPNGMGLSGTNMQPPSASATTAIPDGSLGSMDDVLDDDDDGVTGVHVKAGRAGSNASGEGIDFGFVVDE